MRPSRTREEKANKQLYLGEEDLKKEFQRQAEEKRRQKKLEELRDKEETVQHYLHCKIGAAEDPNDSNNPNQVLALQQLQREQAQIAQMRAELENEGLFKEAFGGGVGEQRRNEKVQEYYNKQQQMFTEGQQQANNQNFLFADDQNSGKQLSKGELERQKRLQLRDQERQRRLMGNNNNISNDHNIISAYDQKPDAKLSLPFQLEKQILEEAGDDGQRRQKRLYDLFDAEEMPPSSNKYSDKISTEPNVQEINRINYNINNTDNSSSDRQTFSRGMDAQMYKENTEKLQRNFRSGKNDITDTSDSQAGMRLPSIPVVSSQQPQTQLSVQHPPPPPFGEIKGAVTQQSESDAKKEKMMRYKQELDQQKELKNLIPQSIKPYSAHQLKRNTQDQKQQQYQKEQNNTNETGGFMDKFSQDNQFNRQMQQQQQQQQQVIHNQHIHNKPHSAQLQRRSTDSYEVVRDRDDKGNGMNGGVLTSKQQLQQEYAEDLNRQIKEKQQQKSERRRDSLQHVGQSQPTSNQQQYSQQIPQYNNNNYPVSSTNIGYSASNDITPPSGQQQNYQQHQGYQKSSSLAIADVGGEDDQKVRMKEKQRVLREELEKQIQEKARSKEMLKQQGDNSNNSSNNVPANYVHSGNLMNPIEGQNNYENNSNNNNMMNAPPAPSVGGVVSYARTKVLEKEHADGNLKVQQDAKQKYAVELKQQMMELERKKEEEKQKKRRQDVEEEEKMKQQLDEEARKIAAEQQSKSKKQQELQDFNKKNINEMNKAGQKVENQQNNDGIVGNYNSKQQEKEAQQMNNNYHYNSNNSNSNKEIIYENSNNNNQSLTFQQQQQQQPQQPQEQGYNYQYPSSPSPAAPSGGGGGYFGGYQQQQDQQTGRVPSSYPNNYFQPQLNSQTIPYQVNTTFHPSTMEQGYLQMMGMPHEYFNQMLGMVGNSAGLQYLLQNRQEIEMQRFLMEEKLRIQQFALQEQQLVEQYKQQLLKAKAEKEQFNEEIQRIELELKEKMGRKVNREQLIEEMFPEERSGGGQSQKTSPERNQAESVQQLRASLANFDVNSKYLEEFYEMNKESKYVGEQFLKVPGDDHMDHAWGQQDMAAGSVMMQLPNDNQFVTLEDRSQFEKSYYKDLEAFNQMTDGKVTQTKIVKNQLTAPSQLSQAFLTQQEIAAMQVAQPSSQQLLNSDLKKSNQINNNNSNSHNHRSPQNAGLWNKSGSPAIRVVHAIEELPRLEELDETDNKSGNVSGQQQVKRKNQMVLMDRSGEGMVSVVDQKHLQTAESQRIGGDASDNSRNIHDGQSGSSKLMLSESSSQGEQSTIQQLNRRGGQGESVRQSGAEWIDEQPRQSEMVYVELQKTADYYKMFKQHIQGDARESAEDEEEEEEEKEVKEDKEEEGENDGSQDISNSELVDSQTQNSQKEEAEDGFDVTPSIRQKNSNGNAEENDGLGQTQLSEVEESNMEKIANPVLQVGWKEKGRNKQEKQQQQSVNGSKVGLMEMLKHHSNMLELSAGGQAKRSRNGKGLLKEEEDEMVQIQVTKPSKLKIAQQFPKLEAFPKELKQHTTDGKEEGEEEDSGILKELQESNAQNEERRKREELNWKRFSMAAGEWQSNQDEGAGKIAGGDTIPEMITAQRDQKKKQKKNSNNMSSSDDDIPQKQQQQHSLTLADDDDVVDRSKVDEFIRSSCRSADEVERDAYEEELSDPEDQQTLESQEINDVEHKAIADQRRESDLNQIQSEIRLMNAHSRHQLHANGQQQQQQIVPARGSNHKKNDDDSQTKNQQQAQEQAPPRGFKSRPVSAAMAGDKKASLNYKKPKTIDVYARLSFQKTQQQQQQQPQSMHQDRKDSNISQDISGLSSIQMQPSSIVRPSRIIYKTTNNNITMNSKLSGNNQPRANGQNNNNTFITVQSNTVHINNNNDDNDNSDSSEEEEKQRIVSMTRMEDQTGIYNNMINPSSDEDDDGKRKTCQRNSSNNSNRNNNIKNSKDNQKKNDNNNNINNIGGHLKQQLEDLDQDNEYYEELTDIPRNLIKNNKDKKQNDNIGGKSVESVESSKAAKSKRSDVILSKLERLMDSLQSSKM